ncbi:MAG: dihydroorotate dehydrogenase-like protein [Anaerolineales bacterium]|nr:dihydroorotate dehydrogenase-like protein [Anaerolineales bacterium]MBS3752749.1 dihydroorotate dehydrogenase-like protein [Anaerolineales bacterium]
MDLSVTYMGLELENPIIVSSSQLTSNLNTVKKAAEHGAGAVVLKSLFEEQLLADTDRLLDQDEQYFWFPEAVDFINSHAKEQGVNEYLTLIEGSKSQTSVPIIGSINCNTPHEWPRFASALEDAGIDGLELNISISPFDPELTSQEIEDRYVEIVTEVKKYVQVPVAVKLGPMFTNPYRLVQQLERAGADAVVLFNRFFQPDIDIEKERIVRGSKFSSPEEMTEPLRWVSLLSNRVSCDLAGNTGIHTAEGVVKHLLAGADAVQVCTTLYKNGLDYLETLISDLASWGQEQHYSSIGQFQGKLSRDSENQAAFERVQYMKKTLAEV